MIEVNDRIIKEMADTIVHEIQPRQIILFGSRARGEAHSDSDIDLLVVVDQDFGPDHVRRNEMARIRKAISGYRIPKDILVYSYSELKKWEKSLNHIVGRSLREGRVLYERF
jgi:uncharacterized protein